MKKIISSLIVVSLVGLTGCGDKGGSSLKTLSYSGSESSAVITAGNAEAISFSSTDVISSIISSDDVDVPMPLGVDVSSISNNDALFAQKTLSDVTKLILSEKSTNLPVGASETITIDGSCGGSATASGSQSSMTITFNDYCESEVVFDGKMTLTQSGTWGVDYTSTVTFNNLKMTYAGSTITMSGKMTEVESESTSSMSMAMTITMDGVTRSFNYVETCDADSNCSVTEMFQGADGTVYQLGDVTYYDYGSGYYFSGTFYDPVHGYVTVNARNIYVCANGKIESGTIDITDASSNDIAITFDADCATMNVSVNSSGVPGTVNQ